MDATCIGGATSNSLAEKQSVVDGLRARDEEGVATTESEFLAAVDATVPSAKFLQWALAFLKDGCSLTSPEETVWKAAQDLRQVQTWLGSQSPPLMEILQSTSATWGVLTCAADEHAGAQRAGELTPRESGAEHTGPGGGRLGSAIVGWHRVDAVLK